MRGSDEQPGYLFSYVSAEARVPHDHPLRPVRALVDAALRRLSPRFDTLYVSSGGLRSPRRNCCARCCCRCSTPFAASASWSSSCSTTCCSSGSSGCRSTMPFGMPPRSPRIVIACSAVRSRRRSSRKCSPRRGRRGCCPPSISPSTARCSSRGPARRVFVRAMMTSPARRPAAIRTSTFVACRDATTRISRRPILTPAWRRKGRGARPNSVMPATC